MFTKRALLTCLGIMLVMPVTAAEPPRLIVFEDITAQVGIVYQHTPSARYAELEALRQEPYIIDQMEGDAPYKAWGTPGVAILDYDQDGDQDIYVTNGPGTNNSLYRNQLQETGALMFEDVAASAGVGALEQDSTGVCYGDTDNDGDSDLYVVGYGQNLFFENQGDGTFIDITSPSGLGSQVLTATGCSMGDIDGDGQLDIVVANAFDLANRRPLVVPYEFNQPNQLFRNQGANVFEDVSASSGILANAGMPPDTAAITWATAMVDYDLDGDLDIFFADDQAGVFSTVQDERRGQDRGFLQLFQNDGSGHFINQTAVYDLPIGDWMGLSFGDLNCDGSLDFFATNNGDYFDPFEAYEWASRWFLGNTSGGFTDSLQGEFAATAFGWGTSIFDYDNDADQDIVYYGNNDAFWGLELSNPGMILKNDACAAQFTHAIEAVATRNIYRLVQGLATGDLNQDGFADIVSVAAMDIEENTRIRSTVTRFGSSLNNIAGVVPILVQSGDGRTQWVFSPESAGFHGGSLSVEINSADNGNQWITVELMGSAGLISAGQVNRDGIGAVIQVTPDGGKPVLKPVLGGSSYASQDSLIQGFGLGRAQSGMIDILWTGGVRNRLYEVQAGEQIIFPEIPCSYQMTDFEVYQSCVEAALADLIAQHIIDETFSLRLLESARRAFEETH